MRNFGKWVLTLGLLGATPGLTFAVDSPATGASPSGGARTPRVDNQRVADNIATALKGKIVGANLGIEFKDGVAILTGSVSDPGMKKLAGSLAEHVGNVSRVDNRITISEKKRSLLDRARGKSSGSDVVQAGLAPQNASTNARSVQQINAVAPAGSDPAAADPFYPSVNPPLATNVAAPSAPAVPPAAAGPSNQDVANQIGAALSDARLDGYDIQIRFANGIASLEGSVGTQAERAAAHRVVSAVPGVRSVSNRLVCSVDERPRQAQYAGSPNPYGNNAPRGDVRGAGYMQAPNGGQPYVPQAGPAPAPGYPGYQGGPEGAAPPYPPAYGYQASGAQQAVYNSPSMPDHAWPTYAQYPNSAAVTYPQQYSVSAWPYIGPFYPYPQVPLGWRDATLRWDDGQWNLMFKPRTDRWWWFFNPNNW